MGATYTGHGRGLCLNYTVPDLCKQQELLLPGAYILAVSYTHRSLTASRLEIQSAYWLHEYPNIADLTLGYDARNEIPNEEYYWERVRDTLTYPMVAYPSYRNVTIVMVSGDASGDSKFRQVLEEVVDSAIEHVLEVIDDDPVYSAAKGVAEFAKRAIYEQNGMSDHEEVVLDL